MSDIIVALLRFFATLQNMLSRNLRNNYFSKYASLMGVDLMASTATFKPTITT